MKQKIIRTLNVYYYAMMILTLLSGTLSYFLIMKGYVLPIDSLSSLGQVIQYLVIFDALITIPLGLFLCKKQCTKLSSIENEEEKLVGYNKSARMRILLVSNTMVFAIAAFYLMGAYQSMLWVAAVSAIGWYFSKPSLRKMELELQPKDPNQENY
jgi:Zn-dependent membrane protease YugP